MLIQACPSRESLSNYGLGKLAEPEMEAIEQHLSHCGSCQIAIEAADEEVDSVILKVRCEPDGSVYHFEPGLQSAVRSALQLVADKEGEERASPEARAIAFREALMASELVSAGDMSPFEDVSEDKALAIKLIGADKLTRFQAREIYQGRSDLLRLDDYVLLDLIGVGGMGLVYKARHRHLARVDAVKVLSPRRFRSAEAVARFEREAELAARIDDRNVVTTYSGGRYGGIHYLAMELVEGSDLASIVKMDGPLPVPQAVDCVIQAARGLRAAHRAGIIHRDVKPHNLLLDTDGVVKVLDLGLARIAGEAEELKHLGRPDVTAMGQIMGTMDYISPEQATETHLADERSDIYSLACTMHYLVTGRPPFFGENAVQKIMAHRSAAIPSLRTAKPAAKTNVGTIETITFDTHSTSLDRESAHGSGRESEAVQNLENEAASADIDSAMRLDVPVALDEAFQRMMAKDAADRPQTMGEVIKLLEAACETEPPSLASRSPRGQSDATDLAAYLETIPDLSLCLHAEIGEFELTELPLHSESFGSPRLGTAVAFAACFVPLLLCGFIVIKWKTAREVDAVSVPSSDIANLDLAGRSDDQNKASDVESSAAISGASIPNGELLVPSDAIEEHASFTQDSANLFTPTDFVLANPLLEDKFDDPSTGFPQGEGRGYSDGRYFIRPAPRWQFAGWHSGFRTPKNFACEVIGRAVGTDGQDGWGICITDRTKEHKTNNHGVQITLRRDGTLYVGPGHWEADKSRPPQLGPRHHEEIKQGDEFNKLFVTYVEHKLRVWINDQEVAGPLFVDRDITIGSLILCAVPSAGGTAEIEEVKVWPIGEPASETSIPTREATATVAWPEDPKTYFSAEAASERQRETAASLNLPIDWYDAAGIHLKLMPVGLHARGKDDEAAKLGLHMHPKPLYMAATEVSQEQYERVMGENPSHFKIDGDAEASKQLPVENVTWFEAIEFCNRLSALEGLPVCYAREGDAVKFLGTSGYRLPAAGEWDYAASEGYEPGWYARGDEMNDREWILANSDNCTHPVGTKQPNAFGLHDMYGNVWEWIHSTKPRIHGPQYIATTPGPGHHYDQSLTYRYHDVGFRVCRDVDPRDTARPRVTLRTSLGDIHLELWAANAPRSVANFIGLARAAYYDGTPFHHVLKGHLIVAGGPPYREDRSGISLWGGHFRGELYKLPLRRGMVIFGGRSPTETTSMFWIAMRRGEWPIHGGHTVFGEIIGGMEVAEMIENLETDAEGKPHELVTCNVIIDSARAPSND